MAPEAAAHPREAGWIRKKYLFATAPASESKDGRPSVSETFVNRLAKDGFSKIDYRSLFEVFRESVQRYSASPCLGRRDENGAWQFETYTSEDTAWMPSIKEVWNKVGAVASALAHVGLKAHSRVGVYGMNAPEWMTAMQACNRMTFYTIPLYDTLGANAVEYVATHGECSVIFVSTRNWPKLLPTLPQLRCVHTIVYWGSDVVDAKAVTTQKVYSFDQFLELGHAHPAEPVPPEPEDLCTIMYTSGTTGNPKGVMLTHSNVLHCIAAQEAVQELSEGVEPPGQDERYLSWLPLAHIMDRAAEEAVLYYGGRIGYWSGSVDKLMEDLLTLQPTLFVAPPRLWDRLYTGAMQRLQASGAVRQFIFNTAYAYKLSRLRAGISWNEATPLLDKLVFAKIGASMGGRMKCIFTGSAPIAPHVEEFLRVAMPVYFSQGYGLTETCGVSFFASSNAFVRFLPFNWLPHKDSMSTVGIPAPSLEYRLESVPDMEYDALGYPAKGEICMRGPCNFAGYFKEPERTAEVLDSDGWFHTGDIGQIDQSGSLRIIDRKKQMFKLSQGEYVSPAKTEHAYEQLPIVEHVFVHGYGTESQLVAVLVPARPAFEAAAAEAGFSDGFEELMRDGKVKAWLLSELTKRGKEAGLLGFEQAKGLVLSDEPFSIENDLLTPTLKFKRKEILARYKGGIDGAYHELRAAALSGKKSNLSSRVAVEAV